MTRSPNFYSNAMQKPPPGLDRNCYPFKPASRWTKADNGRLLPLNHAAWRKLRASVLAEVPLCEYCPPNVITPAVAVDHRNNNPADNTRNNLASTCTSCHSIKTAADMHGTVARLGCDETGHPIAEGHHWNKPSLSRSDASGQKSTEAPGAEPTVSHNVNANCKSVA